MNKPTKRERETLENIKRALLSKNWSLAWGHVERRLNDGKA